MKRIFIIFAFFLSVGIIHGQNMFTNLSDLLRAEKSNTLVPYHPKNLGNKGKKPVDEIHRFAAILQHDTIAYMNVTKADGVFGKMWVELEKETVVRKENNIVYAHDECGNDILKCLPFPEPSEPIRSERVEGITQQQQPSYHENDTAVVKIEGQEQRAKKDYLCDDWVNVADLSPRMRIPYFPDPVPYYGYARQSYAYNIGYTQPTCFPPQIIYWEDHSPRDNYMVGRTRGNRPNVITGGNGDPPMVEGRVTRNNYNNGYSTGSYYQQRTYTPSQGGQARSSYTPRGGR